MKLPQTWPQWMLGAFWMLLALGAMGQGSPGYEPARLSREVPAEVRSDLGQSADGILKKMGKSSLSVEDRARFAYGVALDVRGFHTASYLIYEGLLYDYVNRVVDRVLKDVPDTRAKVRVYVSRSTSVNALTMPDGSIFVNLGLLARLENEAQLAFVLCHEIAHFQQQHGLRRVEKGKEIKLKRSEVKAIFEGTGNPEQILSMFRFSRENESEADRLGMDLFLRSDYDPAAAQSVLEMLRDSEGSREQENVNLYMHFQKREFVIDTSWIKSFTPEELEANRKKPSDRQPSPTIGSSKSGAKKDTLKIDEADLATHPDIAARIAALQGQLERNPKKSGKSESFLQPQEDLEAVRDYAENESILTWEGAAHYSWAVYSSLKKFERQPDNVFLIEKAATNLFWIYVVWHNFKGDAMPRVEQSVNPGYANLLYFFQKLDLKTMGKLVMAFLEGYQEDFPRSETLMILQCRMAGAMGDAKLAKAKYTTYLAQFPNGVHLNFATYQKRNAQ